MQATWSDTDFEESASITSENARFLKSKHYSLLENNDTFTQEIKNNKTSSFVNEIFHSRTKVLSEILDKCKTHGDKRGLEYIETPSNDKIVFFKVVFNALKPKSYSEWYLDSGCFRHMTGDKSSFTSLENYNGGTINFGDRSLACVKGKDSIAILGCPKLDRFSIISQMSEKDHKVNFHLDLYEVVNKEGKVVIIG
ncbi:hypothetical protein AAG906_020064 [Vitis piasezkii]